MHWQYTEIVVVFTILVQSNAKNIQYENCQIKAKSAIFLPSQQYLIFVLYINIESLMYTERVILNTESCMKLNYTFFFYIFYEFITQFHIVKTLHLRV